MLIICNRGQEDLICNEDKEVRESRSRSESCSKSYLREKSLVPDCNNLAYRKGKEKGYLKRRYSQNMSVGRRENDE